MGTEKKTIKLETSEGIKEIDISQEPAFDVDPIEFESFGKTTRMSNIELAVAIREQLQKKFHDCCGCYVGFTNNFEVTVFFENNATPVEAGKFKNLNNLTVNNNVDRKNLYAMNQMLQSRYAGKTFELNEATEYFISEYTFGGRQAYMKNKKQWRQDHIRERRKPAGPMFQPNAESIILAVVGLDIRIICKKLLFGNKIVISTKEDADGKVYNKESKAAFYECRYAKPLPDGSFMINIEQFDSNKVDAIARRENPQFVQSAGILMY